MILPVVGAKSCQKSGLWSCTDLTTGVQLLRALQAWTMPAATPTPLCHDNPVAARKKTARPTVSISEDRAQAVVHVRTAAGVVHSRSQSTMRASKSACSK